MNCQIHDCFLISAVPVFQMMEISKAVIAGKIGFQTSYAPVKRCSGNNCLIPRLCYGLSSHSALCTARTIYIGEASDGSRSKNVNPFDGSRSRNVNPFEGSRSNIVNTFYGCRFNIVNPFDGSRSRIINPFDGLGPGLSIH